MTAVVLAPCERTVEEGVVYRRHLRGAVVFVDTKIFRAEEAEDFSRGDTRHETALLIEPAGIAFLRNARS
jgi:hypothetical protein